MRDVQLRIGGDRPYAAVETIRTLIAPVKLGSRTAIVAITVLCMVARVAASGRSGVSRPLFGVIAAEGRVGHSDPAALTDGNRWRVKCTITGESHSLDRSGNTRTNE